MSVERSELGVERSAPKGAVFLSYARDDAAAARRIAEALRSAGLEVWFDENELRGGDSWDAKIRQQIDACALFVPLISAHTQERNKGYFRLEWKLAVDQTHLLAAGVPFIAPVVIDDTTESAALVPPEFLKVQWTRLPDALPTPPFIAQVKRLLSVEQGAGGREQDRGPRTESSSKPTQSGLSGWTWGALTAVVVGVAVALFVSRKPEPIAAPVTPSGLKSQVSSLPNPPPQADDKSVAVLAFADLSEARNSEYLSDGISEELLNVLAKIPNLRVGARTSAFFFKGKNVPIPEIALKLNVAYVVEGSVQRAGDRVKITAQLIKAADGFHVWSDTFTREIKDVFAVEEEIAGLIAKNLSLKLGMTVGAPGAVAAPTKNPAAYEAYLRGRAAQTRGFSEGSIAETVRFYEEALRLDPDYALAWARLAEACVRIARSGYDNSDEVKTRARSAAATALRLDPNLPEAHLAQARIREAFDNDLGAAGRELDLVEQLRPGEVEVPAVRVSVAYTGGQWGDKLAALVARATEVDPQNADALLTTTPYLRAIGRFAEADRLCDRAIALGDTGEEGIRQKYGILDAWTGDTAATLAVLETTPAAVRERNVRYYNNHGLLLARLGDNAGAIADFERARAAVAKNDPNRSGPRSVAVAALYYIARAESRLGQEAVATRRYAEALVEAEKLVHDYPGLTTPLNLRAQILSHQGQAAKAIADAEAALRLATSQGPVGVILAQRRTKAIVLAALGRIGEAVNELQAVAEAGYAFGYTLRSYDDYDPLRQDPRFQKLMAAAEAQADAQPRPKK